MVGYMRDERVNRILVDGGSSVNILSIHTVKELRIPMNELSQNHVMIQGFNQGGQRAIGAIMLGITIEDMQSSAWLHVIDAKNSCNILLGRPWIHENKNVALPTKRTNEGFDPNAYKLFEKAGYNPNKPSKLGKLPSEDAMRQPREGLGYKQPSPVRISIRRASSNYISVEDEFAASNRPSVFDRLGKSTERTSLMIDATTGYEAISFMDGLSGYNQIRMAPKDEELTTFRTPKGIYCYKAVKGQALADFLVDHPIPDDWELTDELPDEDAMVVEVQPP
ncbi:uncharacterized protein [Nicotiana sylvestris]|uniref:uncharacterized protein n=1 Tax=Nicotiana sylvestris TaxID=4096 RepID=UPI00388C8A85